MARRRPTISPLRELLAVTKRFGDHPEARRLSVIRCCPKNEQLSRVREKLATNAQLVDKAVTIIESMGARVIGPAEVREKLKLTKRAPRS